MSAARRSDATGLGPLAGVRVVALEHAVAGPLCTRHLADLGADVIKVERPGGDFARWYDDVAGGMSAYFVWLNYGKRSVVFDLTAPGDRAAFEQLIGRADVFVHNLGPGAVDRLGYGWAALHARWPRLISCSISGFGPDGPYRDKKAFDLLIQGESGLLSVTGTADSAARVGVSIGDIAAGMYALTWILAALHERRATGEGTTCDVAMLDALAEWMAVPGLVQRYTGSPPPRSGLHHPSIAPYGPYWAVDGPPVLIAVQNDAQWRRLCIDVVRDAALANDPRFDRNERRVVHRGELDDILGRAFGGLERAELLHRLEGADIPNGSLNGVDDLLAHPQLAAAGRWIEVETEAGPVTLPRSPLATSSPGHVPRLDEHGISLRAEAELP